jgi:hypothetical protein
MAAGTCTINRASRHQPIITATDRGRILILPPWFFAFLV